jgi:uncharacterized protein YjcR
MAKRNDREIAQMLFTNGYKQKEIAFKLGFSETTISKWSKEGNWRTKKSGLLTEKDSLIEGLMSELAEYKRMVENKEGFKFSDSKEADARRKIMKDLKDLENEYNLGSAIQTGQDYINHLREIDVEFASQSLEAFDGFINVLIERKKWRK